MVSRIIIVVLAVISAAALAILTWPQALGFQDVYGIAQVVSFRMLMIIAAAVPAFILLILLCFRPTRFFGISFLAVVLAFAFANSLILNARGWQNSSITASTPKTAGDITVLNWNIRGSSVDPQTIADLALQTGAQVVTLPEGFGDTAKQVADIMGAAGAPMWYHTSTTTASVGDRATSLLISTSLGEYQVSDTFGDTTSAPSVVAVPVNGVGPSFAAVHPVAPARQDQMAAWQSDLTWITNLCDNPDFIIGGDFNATLDHLTNLTKCQDAARTTSSAAIGTWPVKLPPVLAAPIDHIMSTTSWKAVSTEIVESEDAAGSDHRPIVSILQPVN